MNKIKHLGFYIIRYYRTPEQKARPKAKIGKSGKGRVGVWKAKKENFYIPPWVKNHKIAPNVPPSFFLLGIEADKIKVDSLSWNILQKEIEKCQ